MNTTTPQVAPTTEIAGALLLNRLDEATLKQFRTDPKATLVSNLNLDVGDDLAINCVDNSADTVHLALPYYESIDAARAEKISDGNMEEVAGGEIIISIIIGAVAGGAIAAVLGGTVGTSAVIGGVVGAIAGTVALGITVGIAVPVSQQQEDQQYQAGLAAAQAEAAGQPAPSGGGK